MQLAGADGRGEGDRVPGKAVLGRVVYQDQHGLLYALAVYLHEPLTFELPFQLGAVLAGQDLGPSRELRQKGRYGDRLELERDGG